ncbi:MAG: cytoskeletal protein RodZ [Verrucomicrobiales bacterium]|jgi:cytoskeletal protein RodZ
MMTMTPELVTTGEYLAGARASRDLSIEDAAHETRIPASHLRALEEGDYQIFDGVAYARSFLRLYGNYLGVDVADGLSQLGEKPELSGKVNHYPFLEAPDKVRFASEMKAPRSSSVPLITVLLALALVLAAPITFLIARNYFVEKPETIIGKRERDASGAVASSPAEELEKIAKLPDGQLERIRSQAEPEVRRAEVVDEPSQDAAEDEPAEEPNEEVGAISAD